MKISKFDRLYKLIMEDLNDVEYMSDIQEKINSITPLNPIPRKLEEWAKTVEITPEIRKQYFISHADDPKSTYYRSWDEIPELEKQHTIAHILHQRDKIEHPELHQELEIDYIDRGFFCMPCSCGYGELVVVP